MKGRARTRALPFIDPRRITDADRLYLDSLQIIQRGEEPYLRRRDLFEILPGIANQVVQPDPVLGERDLLSKIRRYQTAVVGCRCCDRLEMIHALADIYLRRRGAARQGKRPSFADHTVSLSLVSLAVMLAAG
jgi:hypothetical protein